MPPTIDVSTINPIRPIYKPTQLAIGGQHFLFKKNSWFLQLILRIFNYDQAKNLLLTKIKKNSASWLEISERYGFVSKSDTPFRNSIHWSIIIPMNSHRVLPMLNSFAEIGDISVKFPYSSWLNPAMLHHFWCDSAYVHQSYSHSPNLLVVGHLLSPLVTPYSSPLTWLVSWWSLSFFGHLNHIYIYTYRHKPYLPTKRLGEPPFTIYSYHVSFIILNIVIIFLFYVNKWLYYLHLIRCHCQKATFSYPMITLGVWFSPEPAPWSLQDAHCHARAHLQEARKSLMGHRFMTILWRETS